MKTFLSFVSIENQHISSKSILEKEDNYIFQYQLQPIGHKSKPMKGDKLVRVVTNKFACPCCGYKTFREQPSGTYDICQVCFWEDDPIQLEDANYEGGANKVSLRQAQKNFQKFGACKKDMIKNVRQPRNDEARDGNWTWLE